MARPITKASFDRKFDKSIMSEPDWENNPSDPAVRETAKIDRLNYLTYFFDTLKPRSVVVKYLTGLGWTVDQLARFKRAPNWALTQTVEKLIIMQSKGWVLDKSELKYINAALDAFQKNPRWDTEAPTEPSGPAPIRNVHSHLIDAVDDLCDAWMDGKDETIGLFELFNKKPDTQKVLKDRVKPYIQNLLGEYVALKAKDPDVSEGYTITVKQRNHRIKVLKSALTDIDKILNSKKSGRKPRRKKVLTAKRQTNSIKYLAESSEFKLKSIDPKKIIGAKRLYVFNTKYRTITEYVSLKVKGFKFKGSTLQDFDPKLSRTTTLRKPEEFLAHVMKKAPSTIAKEWAKLTTKTIKPTGRINENCILLKAKDK